MTYDLKPCPFCGDISPMRMDFPENITTIVCRGCGARHEDTGQRTISKWNTRAETTADRLLRHIFAENSALRLPEGLADDELDLIKELRR